MRRREEIVRVRYKQDLGVDRVRVISTAGTFRTRLRSLVVHST